MTHTVGVKRYKPKSYDMSCMVRREVKDRMQVHFQIVQKMNQLGF